VRLDRRITFGTDDGIGRGRTGARGNIRFEIWLLRLLVRPAGPIVA
jgi:hypothetical protein